MKVNERIKSRRIELGLSVDELAEKLGINRATIYRYESEDISKLPASILQPLADALRTTPYYLMGWEETSKSLPPTITEDVVEFPVIGDLAAGYDFIVGENWTGETVLIPATYLKGRKREEFIVLSVKGDSMYPMYQHGDKVLILKQECVPHSGAVGAVIYKDELSTLKRVEYGDGKMKLLPINPMYTPIEISGEELNHVSIIGIPKLLIREIEE